MARRKAPEQETKEEAQARRTLEQIADAATRSEKVSWDRKMDNMVTLLAKLRPIEDKIVDLLAEKTPILDEITALRVVMVKECVHPFTHLVDKGDGTAECKFCGRSFKVVKNGS